MLGVRSRVRVRLRRFGFRNKEDSPTDIKTPPPPPPAAPEKTNGGVVNLTVQRQNTDTASISSKALESINGMEAHVSLVLLQLRDLPVALSPSPTATP